MKDFSYKTIILTTFISALVSGVVSVSVNRVADQYFPVKEIEISENFNNTHLGQIRKNVAPLVYSLEYTSKLPEKRAGFLKLRKIPPMWLFRIRIANISNTDIEDIDLRVSTKVKSLFIQIFDIPINNKDHTISNDNCDYILQKIDKLDSSRGISKLIVVYGYMDISLDDLNVSLVCSEGDFDKISPKQYNEIGWE